MDLVRHHQTQPGTECLFTTGAAGAVDPGHPANAWLRHHHRTAAEQLRAAPAEAADDGQPAGDGPVESIVRGVIAAMDGLRIQWLAGPGRPGMAEDFAVLVAARRRSWVRRAAASITAVARVRVP